MALTKKLIVYYSGMFYYFYKMYLSILICSVYSIFNVQWNN